MEYTLIPSPLGAITAVCKDGFLTALLLPGQRGISLENALRQDNEPVLMAVRNWLEQYFAGKAPALDIPLAPKGTVFQQTVWKKLLEVPYGETTTYGQIAATFDGKMSAQAVGQAVGRNPIAILIPCHRVLGSGGKLTGYDGGIDKKMVLLNLEGIPYKP